MGWIEAIVLAHLIFLFVLAAFDGWHWLRCPLCRVARTALKDQTPSWCVWTDLGSHRATEPDRSVVAVFYTQPTMIVDPPPYKLLAVSRNMGTIVELPDDPESPYAIRGRK